MTGLLRSCLIVGLVALAWVDASGAPLLNDSGSVTGWRSTDLGDFKNPTGGLTISPPGGARWHLKANHLELLWNGQQPIQIELEAGWQSPAQGDGLAQYLYGYTKLSQLDDRRVVVFLRHGLMLFSADSGGITLKDTSLHVDPGASLKVELVPTSVVSLTPLGLQHLMYDDLWFPLAWVCLQLESVLAWVASYTGLLIALVLLALTIRALTFPLNSWGVKKQKEFAVTYALLQNRLGEIKSQYTGVERSEETVKAYQEFGISPVSGLKGTLPLLVQLPILIAIFNVSTESSLFANTEFLWASSLALPDRLVDLGIELPILGSALNVFPLMLGVAGWWASRSEDQKLSSGLLLHLLITILCYSFSAAVVLYWLFINLLQVVERRLLSRD